MIKAGIGVNTFPMTNNGKFTELKLVRIADRELWYAEAQDKSWSLPLWVDWLQEVDTKAHYGMVVPAFAFYATQLAMLQSLLSVHNLIESRNTWLTTRKMVEALLHKAPGITENYYYRWPDDNCPPIPIEQPIRRHYINELPPPAWPKPGPFAEHVSRKWGLPIAVVHAVFRAIQSEGGKWMYENRCALDLGFCKLVCAPFRSNWKEIVAFKFRGWKLLSTLNLAGKKKEEALLDLGMPQALCSPHIVAMKATNGKTKGRLRSSILRYTIEAIPSDEFERQLDEMEMDRLSDGKMTYVAHFEHTVEKLYTHLVEALAGYMRKAASPFAAVLEGGIACKLSFVPTAGRRIKVCDVPVNNLPVHIIPPTSPFSVLGEQSDPNLVYSQIKPLPEMPALSSPADDLRECDEHGEVVEYGDGPARADRLPLSNVDQVGAAGQPMLPILEIESGNASGLDGEGDP